MITQTIFKAGNSHVVSLPSQILSSLHLHPGDKVVIESHPEAEIITIRKPSSSNKISGKEFDKWLKTVLREDAEVLDMLA